MTDGSLSPLPYDDPDFWGFWYFDEFCEYKEYGSGSAEAFDEARGAAEGAGPRGGAGDDRVVYDAGGGRAVLVEAGPFELTLSLLDPGSAEPLQLGWDDQAHPTPYGLHWREADVLCRAAALADPRAAYPGPHLALLSRFAPVCDEADAATALPLLREAFAGLPGLDAYQRLVYASLADLRASGIRWVRDEDTGHRYPDEWFPDEDEDESGEGDGDGRGTGGGAGEAAVGLPYAHDPDREHFPSGSLGSLRSPEYPDFPFDALAATVEQARLRCAETARQPWAAAEAVRAAAHAFGRDGTAARRAELRAAVRDRGCTDAAVLDALAPEAGTLRALVMTELLLGVEPGVLLRAHRPGAAPAAVVRRTARPAGAAARRTAARGSQRAPPTGRFGRSHPRPGPLPPARRDLAGGDRSAAARRLADGDRAGTRGRPGVRYARGGHRPPPGRGAHAAPALSTPGPPPAHTRTLRAPPRTLRAHPHLRALPGTPVRRGPASAGPYVPGRRRRPGGRRRRTRPGPSG
ncbi:hypothetical protein DEH18_23730 [Streptomyces sp. NHF165]|uniref:hypothetical protein n=1 Tax=Streptomyces sp. NHF165 TaxID=2175864 RepID=UPI00132ED91E|nr:hypothetical protein [Streptomyces sp. NHF165]QHF96354.1 hypothetical protein DEH18_23730 [Streptomyces sp. NHF165]